MKHGIVEMKILPSFILLKWGNVIERQVEACLLCAISQCKVIIVSLRECM